MLREGKPTTMCAELATVPQAAKASPAQSTPAAARPARRRLVGARLMGSLFILGRLPLRRAYLPTTRRTGRSRRCTSPDTVIEHRCG